MRIFVKKRQLYLMTTTLNVILLRI